MAGVGAGVKGAGRRRGSGRGWSSSETGWIGRDIGIGRGTGKHGGRVEVW